MALSVARGRPTPGEGHAEPGPAVLTAVRAALRLSLREAATRGTIYLCSDLLRSQLSRVS